MSNNLKQKKNDVYWKQLNTMLRADKHQANCLINVI